jgi:hypothetical protein
MTFLAASPSNELLGYFHKSLRDRKNDFVRPCKNEKICNYSAAKRHKRHKQGRGWNMDLMEPVKLDLNRSRACSRCAFCAFLRLCLR